MSRRPGALALCIAITATLSACAGSSKQHAATTATAAASTTTPTTIPSATAAQIAAGRWSVIPAAPIKPRDSAAVVWTGKELIVWGGELEPTGRSAPVVTGDGAAYDPATRAWRVLPPAPLPPQVGAAAVWTGSELVVWGGVDARQEAADRTTVDQAARPQQEAAAYLPATNSWKRVGTPPIPPVVSPIAIWTGDKVIVLAGGRAASFDPATGRWERLPAPHSVHQPISWQLAVAAGPRRIVAWSMWETQKPARSGTTLGSGGSDGFRYDEATNGWTALHTDAAAAIPQPEEAFWTGTRILLRGDLHTPGAAGPGPIAEASDWYDAVTGAATRLPPDALTAHDVPAGNFSSAWAGDALLSLDATGQAGPIGAGDASVYDAATSSWTRLNSAPFGCATAPTPEWTGTQVLVYCSEPYPEQPHAVGGLAYTIG
jgi:N-acetylneuraminic acid mutarotase